MTGQPPVGWVVTTFHQPTQGVLDYLPNGTTLTLIKRFTRRVVTTQHGVTISLRGVRRIETSRPL